MTARLDPETRRLRALTTPQLADEYGRGSAQLDRLKAEAVRREVKRAEGLEYRLSLTPPGESERFDRPAFEKLHGRTLLLPFLRQVAHGWSLRCYPKRPRA
jgi:hypothetical protein